MKSLAGKVALVAGSARGAGRAIAVELGALGATVYCTARSTSGQLVDPKRPETIDETAAMVSERGGVGVAVRVDHTDAAQVAELMALIKLDSRRLDILINNTNADALHAFRDFWAVSLEDGLTVLKTAIHSHLINIHEAVPLMRENGSGLVVEITDGDGIYYRGSIYYDLTKINAIRMALIFARELRQFNIASLAVTPGFLRSEAMLEGFGVTEQTWREVVKERPEFIESETPAFVGRAIANLAADADLMSKSGRVFNSAELAREYNFTDVDGRTPDIWTYFDEHMPQYGMKKIDEVFYSYLGTPGVMEAEMKRVAEEVAER